MQLKPVLGLFPVAVYGYPRYFIAVWTIEAPETELALRVVDDALDEYVGELEEDDVVDVVVVVVGREGFEPCST